MSKSAVHFASCISFLLDNRCKLFLCLREKITPTSKRGDQHEVDMVNTKQSSGASGHGSVAKRNFSLPCRSCFVSLLQADYMQACSSEPCSGVNVMHSLIYCTWLDLQGFPGKFQAVTYALMQAEGCSSSPQLLQELRNSFKQVCAEPCHQLHGDTLAHPSRLVRARTVTDAKILVY